MPPAPGDQTRTPEEKSNQTLTALAPQGYYLAVRIGFATPQYEENTLPAAWVQEYTERGLMLFDPIWQWIYSNTGNTRWSALGLPDPHGILLSAREHGMRFGAVACVLDPATKQRSFASVARIDRELTRQELEELQEEVRRQHILRRRPDNLTRAELEVLQMLCDGQRFKQIAFTLGISESAVKARLTNAKRKLGATTSAQAVTKALSHGLI